MERTAYHGSVQTLYWMADKRKCADWTERQEWRWQQWSFCHL